MAALMHRARELGIINENQYVYLRIQLQEKGYRYREPAELDFPKEQPTLLTEVIQAHLRDLGFGYSDIAEMAGMHLSEFKTYHRVEPSGLRVVQNR